MVVIDKPAGMVVNRAQTVKNITVQDWFAPKLQSYRVTELQSSEFLEKGGIVHRLDKETSGVLLLAKTLESYEGLKKQFLERKVKKIYLTLVHGRMSQEEGIISTPIERHPKIYGKFMIGKDLSRTAVTQWKVVNRYQEYTLLEVTPLTGRTHQIRVHLAHLGYPVAGDSLYGKGKQVGEERRWCPRLFLHASDLQFMHPITGRVVDVGCDLPAELRQVLASLLH